jgi:hypothetical protein
LPNFYFCQVGLPNCWRPIFLILSKLDRCQVDLPNCWSYSKAAKKEHFAWSQPWFYTRGCSDHIDEDEPGQYVVWLDADFAFYIGNWVRLQEFSK